MTSHQKSAALFGAALIVIGCSAEPSPLGPSNVGILIGDGGDGSGGAPVIGPDDAGSGGSEMDAPIINNGSGGDNGSGGAIVDAPVVMDTPPAMDKPPVMDAPMEMATPVPFTCNHVIGLGVVGQWWPSFESMMDNARWQYVSVMAAYVESWVDPNNMVWQTAVASSCATRSATPDRVLFVAFDPNLTTQMAFQTSTTAAVATIRKKFPTVKRIELLSTVRSPKNQLCPGADPGTVVPAYVDAALAAVATASGGDVVVGPKIEVTSCSWWGAMTTALAGTGPAGVGALYADYYKSHL